MLFLFLIIPLCIEFGLLIYTSYVDLYSNTFLLIFFFHLVSGIIVWKIGFKIFKKKILSIVIFLIVPLITLFICTSKPWGWYKVYSQRKVNNRVYIVNTSNEDIRNVIFYCLERDNTLIDKYFEYFHNEEITAADNRINSANEYILNKHRNSFLLRDGRYKFRIETQDISEKPYKYFETSLNSEEAVLDKNGEIFFCYDGTNFFQFTPTDEERSYILENYEIKKTIEFPKDQAQSEKQSRLKVNIK